MLSQDPHGALPPFQHCPRQTFIHNIMYYQLLADRIFSIIFIFPPCQANLVHVAVAVVAGDGISGHVTFTQVTGRKIFSVASKNICRRAAPRRRWRCLVRSRACRRAITGSTSTSWATWLMAASRWRVISTHFRSYATLTLTPTRPAFVVWWWPAVEKKYLNRKIFLMISVHTRGPGRWDAARGRSGEHLGGQRGNVILSYLYSQDDQSKTLTHMFPRQCKWPELHVCKSVLLGRGGGGDGGHVAQSERHQQHHRQRSRHPRRQGRSRQGELTVSQIIISEGGGAVLYTTGRSGLIFLLYMK